VAALRAAGVEVCSSPAEIGETVKRVLSRKEGG
ncbi:MAG: succinate--CoA ligase subunit alpha, partial [Deltaproteobacteria bacterium]